MAQVVVTKVTEADSHLVVRGDMLSDGTGELQNYIFLSPSDLNPARKNNKPTFRIMQAWYGLVWFDVSISAGTLQPVPLWTFPRDHGPHVDFRSFGGVIDTGVYEDPAIDDSGKLCMTTNGFAQLGSQGSLVIELRKTNG